MKFGDRGHTTKYNQKKIMRSWSQIYSVVRLHFKNAQKTHKIQAIKITKTKSPNEIKRWHASHKL